VINEELEFKIEQLDLMVKRWKRFFSLYRKISKPGEASPKEEREFAELSTYFTRTYSTLASHVGLNIQGHSNILSMVTDVPDAEGVRELADMRRRKFENDWRANNTALNQKLGELQLLSEQLQDVSELAYYGKRFFSNRVVQWTLGISLIVVLLGVFGVFRMLFQFLSDVVNK